MKFTAISCNIVLASFQGSSPAFCRILYKKWGDSLDDFITCAMTCYVWVCVWFG